MAAKEASIAEKEAAYALLRCRLSRLPDPAAGEQLATYQASLKSKQKQLRALETELVSASFENLLLSALNVFDNLFGC